MIVGQPKATAAELLAKEAARAIFEESRVVLKYWDGEKIGKSEV